jgi:hypothetical protein
MLRGRQWLREFAAFLDTLAAELAMDPALSHLASGVRYSVSRLYIVWAGGLGLGRPQALFVRRVRRCLKELQPHRPRLHIAHTPTLYHYPTIQLRLEY